MYIPPHPPSYCNMFGCQWGGSHDVSNVFLGRTSKRDSRISLIRRSSWLLFLGSHLRESIPRSCKVTLGAHFFCIDLHWITFSPPSGVEFGMGQLRSLSAHFRRVHSTHHFERPDGHRQHAVQSHSRSCPQFKLARSLVYIVRCKLCHLNWH